jgi:hypothetical protein
VLLIELDRRTRFLDCFVHAGGRKQARSAELKRSILAVLIAMATNLGLARMSEACGVPCDVLAWTAEWYVREETLREANTCIVNHHHSLELAGVFGGGTMSSSDGQRFPVRGKSLTGREMTVFGGQNEKFIRRHDGDQPQTHAHCVARPRCEYDHLRAGPPVNWPKISEWEEGFDLTQADDEYAEARPYADPRH